MESAPVGSGSLSCAIAVEGTEVESAPVGSGSPSFGLRRRSKDTSLTLTHTYCTCSVKEAQ